ncbi:hypothetical protein DAI22_11g231900 [Oryza sativa Japonica Group]|nr:hypothetical protein DAI22_11g231900 [Oryza sativa Japonica Group]
MAATKRMAYSISVVFMLLLIISSTFSSCYAAKDMKDREAIIQRHREECKKTCRERHTYCPPEMPCCCMKNAPASSPSSVKNESGDGLVIN